MIENLSIKSIKSQADYCLEGFDGLRQISHDFEYLKEDYQLDRLPFTEIFDPDQACHDGQEGQVIIEFEDEFFAFDYSYSSWGDGWLGEKVYKVIPRQETVTFYDKVKE